MRREHRPERPHQTHVQAVLHQLRRLLLEAPDSSTAPGVVDEDVDCPELVDGRRDHRLDIRLARRIGLDEDRGIAERVGRLLAAFRVEFRDDDARPFFHVTTRDGLADSDSAAGHDGDASVELTHEILLFVLRCVQA